MFYFFYYFPLGIDLPVRRRVWATWSIALACIVVFVIQQRAPMILWNHYEQLVFVPAHPQFSAMLLNAYLHGGWLHLIGNLISLLVFAPALEERLGTRRFLLLYHLSNVLANMVQGALILLFLRQQAETGVLGASGAIAGLLGLFVVRLHFANLRVGYWAFMPLQAFNRCGAAIIPALFAIVVWFGMQLGMVLVQLQGAAAGIACGSHLGGLVGGIGLGLLFRLRPAALAEQHLRRGRSYLDRALWYPAQGEFIEYVRRQQHDPEGHLELARTYRLTGRHLQADHHYRESCHRLAVQKRLDRVEEVYREAHKGSPMFALGAPQQLQLAQLLERSLKPEAAELAYLSFADRYPDALKSPLALYRAASLASRRREAGAHAHTLYQRLVDHYPQAAEADLARRDLRHLPTAA